MKDFTQNHACIGHYREEGAASKGWHRSGEWWIGLYSDLQYLLSEGSGVRDRVRKIEAGQNRATSYMRFTRSVNAVLAECRCSPLSEIILQV